MGKLNQKPIEEVLLRISKIFSVILLLSFIFVNNILCQETKIYNSGNSPLPVDKLTCLAVDSVNSIWIGAVGGVYHLSDNSWTRLDTVLGIYNASEYEPFIMNIKT